MVSYTVSSSTPTRLLFAERDAHPPKRAFHDITATGHELGRTGRQVVRQLHDGRRLLGTRCLDNLADAGLAQVHQHAAEPHTMSTPPMSCRSQDAVNSAIAFSSSRVGRRTRFLSTVSLIVGKTTAPVGEWIRAR